MRIISQRRVQFLPQLFILPSDICACERVAGARCYAFACVYARPPYSLDSGHKTYCARYGASEEEEKASKHTHCACACSFAIMIMYEPRITPLLSATIFAASVALMQKAPQYPFRDAARV
jgi:hypothetical protein